MTATPRVLPEERHTLRGKGFTVVTSNRGASIASITPTGFPCITRDVPGELEHGRKSGFFVALRNFARLPGRKLRFGGQEFTMVYPPDIDAAAFDPQELHIHGSEYLYTWETVAGANEDEICYALARERFPVNDPLPYTGGVSFRVEDQDLIIRAWVENPRRRMPAQLVLHPFFRWHLGDPAKSIQLKARLNACFDYPPDALLPMSAGPPTLFDAPGGPYAKMTALTPTLDHSHRADSGMSEIHWPDGPRIRMSDETIGLKGAHYLQLWTTQALAANVCGVEHGGPTNAFNLVVNGHLPEDHLIVVEPGQRRERRVRYTLL